MTCPGTGLLTSPGILLSFTFIGFPPSNALCISKFVVVFFPRLSKHFKNKTAPSMQLWMRCSIVTVDLVLPTIQIRIIALFKKKHPWECMHDSTLFLIISNIP